MNYISFNFLKIGGKMSKENADKVGLILAEATSISLILFALSTLIYVVRWW